MATISVQTKRPDTEAWLVWPVGGGVLRLARSLEDVLRIAAAVGCPPEEIRWQAGAYGEMVEAGVAPAGGHAA